MAAEYALSYRLSLPGGGPGAPQYSRTRTIGLGAVAVRARAVTDEMFTAAAVRLAELVPAERIARRCVFPAIGALREVSREIALVVARTAVAQGLAQDERAAADVAAAIDRKVWQPRYPRLVRGPVAG
jgi:malate dehydrogenase (oxaloacetate-decarboxylating)